jgi:hypothetical protein
MFRMESIERRDTEVIGAAEQNAERVVARGEVSATSQTVCPWQLPAQYKETTAPNAIHRSGIREASKRR